MINQGNNVPDNTIAIFIDEESGFDKSRIPNIVKKPDKQREWFGSNFYNCMPLNIGNQYGFVITSEYAFNVIWDGSPNKEGLHITPLYPNGINDKQLEPQISSIFGHGILTIFPPFVFRTPIGVNLMTVNPTNHIVKNATVLSGVVETDHSPYPFSFNIRIQEPNIITHFPVGTPLAGFIPIPRYFADKFEIQDAEEIFDEQIVNEQLQMIVDHNFEAFLVEHEAKINNSKIKLKRGYFKGKDVYGCPFPDHQKP